jgi:hypothetical protein
LSIDASGTVPLPHFVVVPWLTASRIYGVPQGHAFYDEMNRLVVEGHWLGAARVAAAFTWGPIRRYRVGFLAEQVWAGRSSPTTRLGPEVQIVFSPHWDVLGVATWPVAGPDSLGVWNAAYGTVALRWKGATGEDHNLK